MGALTPVRAQSHRFFALTWLVSILASACLLPIASIFWVNFHGNWMAGWCEMLFRQKTLIAQRRAENPRRLFIVGGSSALFGIDAELIERKLKIPTINFGIQAGLGFAYQLDRVQRQLHPGDVVLLCPEYDTWVEDNRDADASTFIDYVWTYDKSYLHRMSARELGRIIWNMPVSAYKDSLAHWTDIHAPLDVTGSYNVASLSPCGDIRVLLHKPFELHKPVDFDATPGTLSAFGDFCAFARANHILVLHTWPNIADAALPDPALVKSPRLLSALGAGGLALLDTPGDNVFPEPWFMDTEYHPNPACRRIRTEALIRRLRGPLGLPPAPAQASGYFLLAGRDHRLSDGNIFPEDSGVEFRYLQATSIADPRAITAAQVANLVRRHIPIYTDSPDAAPLLASAGLSEKPYKSESLSISQWLARHPSNLILLAATVGHPWNFAWKSAVPATVDQLFSAPAPAVAVFGTGPYAAVQRTSVGFDGMLDSLLPGKCVIPCHIELYAQGATANVTIDGIQFCSSPTGICAVALDPELGSVVESVVFEDGSDTQLWHVNQVVQAGD